MRGGRKPLMLAVFFNEKIPLVIIEQFMGMIADQLAEFKLLYHDSSIVEQYLKKIYNHSHRRIAVRGSYTTALQLAEVRYQTLFKTARDAILILEKNNFMIFDANEQTVLLLQRPLEMIIGFSLTQLQPPAIITKFTEQIMQQINSLQSAPFEMSFIATGNIKVPVEISAGEIQLNRKKVIQCIIRDASWRKILEV